MSDIFFMRAALDEARAAEGREEVPIGAVIVYQEEIIARAGNRTRELHDPSAHAEILAIREACQKLGTQRIPDCDLYVTLEPCTMCAAAIAFARVRRLVIGTEDVKGGGVKNGVKFFTQPTCHHRQIEIISNIEQIECQELLQAFFRSRREKC